ncbi:hypothetical protein GJAV_G00125050 [Gymnothorax javanicus]|nr:hypothetical protein GJAV_G00125050 [Gymnothorax javanicus]
MTGLVLTGSQNKNKMALAILGSLVMVAVLSTPCNGVPVDANCTGEGLSIRGGNYTLSDGLRVGSTLIYRCLEGYYPYPAMTRQCQRRGRWSPTPDSKRPQECKRVTCPDPLVFENGDVFPIQMIYYVTNETTFKCFDGYNQWGSRSRICQSNGKWNGSTPICDSASDHCPDPGVPPGARRTGRRFGIDDKVTYRCDQGLTLLGSDERVCLESGEWTGVEPACYSKFAFDNAEEVARSFAASLQDSLGGDDGGQEGKKIRLQKAGNLHIYIALDYSESVKEPDFEWSKICVLKLIEKISFFPVNPKYGILAFATEPKWIVDIADPNNENIDIIAELTKFKYYEKGDKSGTNIAAAFADIHAKMSFLEANNKQGFKDIQQVIIMFTDGRANMGGSAAAKVDKIRSLLNVANNREDFLDIYVFGLGNDIDEREIDKLVSKKPPEKHFFKLKSKELMEEMLDLLIDEDKSVLGTCGVYRDYDKDSPFTKRWRYPWVARVEVTRQGNKSDCMGALVSSHFVLTAAHCLRISDKTNLIKVRIEDGDNMYTGAVKEVETFMMHEKYDVQVKADQGIAEFYDYDVALIQLKKAVKFSPQVRPICIPCTEETNRALKLDDKATCKDHENLLLKGNVEHAQFMDIKKLKFKNVTIKLDKNLMASCLKDVKDVMKIDDATEMVTENFLCTGGIEKVTDNVACKGDSGGPLFLERRRRRIQVGVVSFGIKNLCQKESMPLSDAKSRDFHINLFKVQPFLKKYLGDGTKSFAPTKFID